MTDTLHGVVVVDPYRWMEEGGEELAEWLKAQDAYTRALLERIPGREALLAELRELNTDAMTVSRVRRLDAGWVYLEREPGAGVARLVLRDDATGARRVLVDPATLSVGLERFTIDGYEVSPRGNAIAYLAPADGGFFGTLRILDVATGRTLPDSVGNVFHLGAWRPDGRAFTYTRLRDLPPDAPPLEQDLCPMTYLHLLGTDPVRDEAVAGCGVSPRIKVAETTWARVLFFPASRYAVAWVPVDPALTGLDLYTVPVDSLAGPDTPWRVLARAEDRINEVVLRGDTAYMVSSLDAPRRRVIRTSVLAPDLEDPEVLVPESEAVIAMSLSAAGTGKALYLAKDALYVRLLDAGMSRLLRVPFDGSEHHFVPLPFSGAVPHISSDTRLPGLVFALVSWLKAPRFYAFRPDTGVQDLELAPPHPAERAGYQATRVHVQSEDGMMVPLTLLHESGLRRDGSHPTRLQGYGAYGLVPEPGFRPTVLPWLARGGIDAICHVRGGGEYGDEWHRAGQKENKVNTVSDFIACAEYLVREGYTRPERLAGLGASAGGLTIGGAITRRPELFAAAQAAVPLADLLRFEFGRNGPGNVPEFGTVTDPEQFRFMLPVSPYHQIRQGTAYPAVLVSTAINDIAMPLWQPAKLAARLQEATSSGKPVLLRVDWGSGHFGGTTTGDTEARVADAYAFMLWQMGVEGFQAPSEEPDR